MLEKVKITHEGTDPRHGVHVFVNDKELHRVKGIRYEQNVDAIPTFDFTVYGIPDLDTYGEVNINADLTNKDYINIVQALIETDQVVFDGFKASITAALKKYAMPFQPEEELAEKILKFLIGDE